MKSILEACQPRQDLLQGSFNPEIFTAMLSQVISHYRGQGSTLDNVYTNADTFFQEATFPTEGLKLMLSEVFGRIQGDNTVPAIHRLETAFGGGKTHALISCAHLGFRGKELDAACEGVVDSTLLPAPGELSVVGVAGDDLPVRQPKGEQLIPHTLWGEIAFQIGGEALYREVEEDVTSYAAPGKGYFDTVFGNRKCLIMLDELAQYATRLEAAQSGGGQQLAAFLMSLHGYARSHSGISVVLTLASRADAFSRETQKLQKLVAEVKGEDVGQDEASALAERGESDIRSVVARDATTVTPVQPAEISRILAKRLFNSINSGAAKEAAKEYMELYRKHGGMLPEEANRADFEDRLIAHYPFHPTFVAYLSHKLASVENFQGTRGVLRVLALAIRGLWERRLSVPMIHTPHLNLRESRTVNEIIGRTGSNDLLNVLNTDIGGVDTGTLEGGRSNAELADLKNPHPEGYPIHELTWKTVFLHSLIGRDEGLSSNLFGITEQEAMFETCFPGLTPPQVATALKEIENSAFYLRHREGRFFASLDPSVNQALARIRRTRQTDQINQVLAATARKTVKAEPHGFDVLHDVYQPEDIPDGKTKPQLALISLEAETIDPMSFVTTVGPGKPRRHQNIVLLLVPGTVQIQSERAEESDLFSNAANRTEQTRNRIQDLARTVLAMRKLKENPQHYGISQAKLKEQDFEQRHRERENALITAVSEAYHSLWYPSAAGRMQHVEFRTSGAEGGASVIEQIRQSLLEEKELIPSDQVTNSDLLNLGKLFFESGEILSLEQMHQNFLCKRDWPILENRAAFDNVVKGGVGHGHWCLYRMEGDDATKPTEIYCRSQQEVPLGLDLNQGDWSIVTVAGANKRGWTEAQKVDKSEVKDWVRYAISNSGAATLREVGDQISQAHGEVPENDLADAVNDLVTEGRLVSYKGAKEQTEKPTEMVSGTQAALHQPQADDVLITKKTASEKGWIPGASQGLVVEGQETTAANLLSLLRRVGSLYGKGGKTRIDTLQLAELKLPDGGSLQISLADASPQSVQSLAELFEVLHDAVKVDDGSEAFLEIREPSEDCPFYQEVKKQQG